MIEIYEPMTAALGQAQVSVPQAWDNPSAAWDVKSLLTNAKTWVQTAGGMLLMLLGAAALVWGGVKLFKKLTASKQKGQETEWWEIIALIIVGGAMATGGWQLISMIGSGGQETIQDLGTGTVIVGQLLLDGLTGPS
ncbi:hypothetical protein [Arthrobacter castelli]|uniref:hypothetical protein n=1 Tax=Arthrobacter castelli TaxID=271431 RepID=UPI00041ABEB8|nr:hypothetical protein [Arthrobacter castelli]